MTMKFFKSHIYCLLLVTAWLFVLSVSSSFAFPVTVCSEYFNAISQQWENETTWFFDRQDDNTIVVTRVGADEPVIVLKYDRADNLVAITKRLTRGDKIIELEEEVQGPVVLSEGFPVPYDDLSSLDLNSSQLEMTETIADFTFSSAMTREISVISPAEAHVANMIDQATAATLAEENLRLITIRKAGKLVVQQLWAEGAKFWLFEQTPGRRSWFKR